MTVVQTIRKTKRALWITGMVALVLSLVAGCGGGTSGTGLGTSSYAGQVKSVTGEPIAGATVTISNTGDSTVTEAAGQFLLESDVPDETIQFLIEAPSVTSVFSVSKAAAANSQNSLEIVVDANSNVVELNHFVLEVEMVDECARYFENGDVILQTKRVPKGTVCTLHAVLRGDGKRRANIPVALQTRACTGTPGHWKTIETAETESGKRAGVAEINFEFIQSRQRCQYRVVAPHEYEDYRPVFFNIETLAEQAVDE